jgi:UDP-glucose 4-epimerase
MAKIIIENNDLVYSSLFKKERFAIEEIQWAYMQIETINVSACCGNSVMEIVRLILRAQDDKVVLEIADRKKAEEILASLKQSNPKIVIGYNKNWENIFQQNYPEFLQLSNLK